MMYKYIYSIINVAGPVSGTLTNRFDHRKVAMIGGIVGSMGLVTTSWATRVWHLYITYGFITGLQVRDLPLIRDIPIVFVASSS